MREQTEQEIKHARTVVIRGFAVLAILWIIGMTVFVQQIPRHHGYAIHVPGGIEIYP